jgi:nucleotide-binding universal stress UspA family protein
MAYKTILLHVDTARHRRARLDLAFALAKRYDAHLIAHFALRKLDVPVDPNVSPMWLADMLERRRAAGDEAAREFHAKVDAERYAARSEWRVTLGDGLQALEEEAKCADLVIAGQPCSDGPDGGVPASFSEQLVMSVARPVLYVPYAGRFDDCGRRVLVPWNGSRQAGRALADAIPFLQRAEANEVITFDREAPPGPDLPAFLARHDAAARVVAQPSGGIGIGQAILSRAADHVADLIVMGAYSHRRLRELVLGGATREVFRSMTVPTLMSH